HIAYGNVVINITGNDGWHNIEYYSIDALGNEEQHHVATYYLDNTPPTTTLLPLPSQPNGENGWYISNISINFSSHDNGTGVKAIYYKIGNQDWKNFEGTFILEEGNYTLYYYAVDEVGNEEVIHIKKIKIDCTPPHAWLIKSPLHIWSNESVYFEWRSDDANTLYSYKMENYSGWSEWSNAENCSFILEEGNYTFLLKAKDIAGNENILSYSFSINFSFLLTSIQINPRYGEWIGLNSSINFTCNRNGTIYYRIWHNGWHPSVHAGTGKGNNFTVYHENFTLWSLGYTEGGIYYIEFYSMADGITEKTRNESFKVDSIKPAIHICIEENLTCRHNINIQINSSDDFGIGNISIYYSYSKNRSWNDWNLVGVTDNDKCNFSFNFSRVGFYAFMVRCMDLLGNENFSEAIIRFYNPDLNNDSRVNIFDVVKLTNYWGSNSYFYDLNGNGNVGFEDIAILFKNWSYE
ncbi:MAG: hypothetical protein J7K95_00175, partial [Thermoplasmata archaeon]|nr:hypothetical protein [Thermoplasmata archaeon]